MTQKEASVERARFMLETYRSRVKTDEDLETITADILADILHLDPELDLDAVVARANRYYEADAESDDDGVVLPPLGHKEDK